MKKNPLITAIALALGTGGTQAAQFFTGPAQASGNNNFTMLQPESFVNPGDGLAATIGGTNDIAITYDGSLFTASSDYTGPAAGEDPMASATPPPPSR